jgi:hypothetical protein
MRMTKIKSKTASNNKAEAVLKSTGFEALQTPENYQVPISLMNWESALDEAIIAKDSADEKSAREASTRMHFTATRSWVPFGILIEKPRLSDDAQYFEIHSDLYDPKAKEQVKGAVRKCKLLDNRGRSAQPLLIALTKAFAVAQATGQAVVMDSSAYGKWDKQRWFDSACIKLVS